MTKSIQQTISEFKAKALREREADRLSKQQQEQEWRCAEAYKRKTIRPCLRLATLADYHDWLKGYLEAGNEPTHLQTHFAGNRLFIAHSDFKMIPLYGAGLLEIIIPANIKVDITEGYGHCHLYFMEGFCQFGNYVPLYEELEF